MKYKINFGIDNDSISISDEKGEVVYWSKDEWVENEDLIFTIVNAVQMAYMGKNLRKILK